MKLVFWQRLASPHQAPFARELASALGPGGVTCLFRSRLFEELRQQGWEEPDYGAARVVVGLNATVIERALQEAGPDAVHVFSSLSHDSVLRGAYFAAVRNGNVIGLLSEARDWRGGYGLLRRVDSFRHERRWRRDLAFVLAMGGVGRQWFELCGYESHRIVDFCYVVERPNPEWPAYVAGRPVRIVYVGQLIPRKRVDLLLRAAARLSAPEWTLEIIGSGALRESLEQLTRQLGLAARVVFRGSLGNSAVRTLLAESDLLVLPSYWDGWGAVVNEALSAGTRVVCSDHCGVADLLPDHRFGRVFIQGSVDSLAEALEATLALGPIDPTTRRRIYEYSASFAGPAVAEYLQRIVASVVAPGGERPEPPWRVAAREKT